MLNLRTAAATAVMATSLSASAFAGGIESKRVTFESDGATLVGTLYLPAEARPGKPVPAVVVTGAWTTVKEQMAGTYAAEMAERGYAALAFDFRGWGQSGDLPGKVRYKEDPAAKIADIKAALRFIATLPNVDRSRINGLGICASAGYMVDATANNPLVNRVGLVAPWLQNGAIVESVYGGKDGVGGLIATSKAAAAKGGEIIPAAGPAGTPGVLMAFDGYYSDPKRGLIPAYDNKWDQASWEGWLTYHPADNPARLDKPLAIVHSEAAAIPQGVKTFLEGYAGKATVEWLENVTQFDFYDQDAPVNRAADTVAGHFSGNS